MAKRLFDIVVATIGIIGFSPLLLCVAASVWICDGRPILFRQLRPGLHGKPFKLIKFRTMRNDPELCDGIESDARRLTRLGRFLRGASLDELPELWNVLRGEMSLVGPRPLLMEYLDRYTPEQARRHLVPPGLTGWAQINGRNSLTWEERFRLDVWYVENRTFWLDFKILILTLCHLLRPQGISAAGSATMPEFQGSTPLAPQDKVESQQRDIR